MSKDTINVYWAPQASYEIDGKNWNMLYPEPTNLFAEMQKLKTPEAGTRTYFSCPATSKRFKNTYVFRNDLFSSYTYDFTLGEGKNYFTPVSPTYLNTEVKRPPSIKTGPLVEFKLFYSVFSDEPLEASFTPPMMHPAQYTRYGTSIPGDFDIGQWFRPYPLEMQMWNMKGEFHLKEGEPLFYVYFNTDKKINLQRFEMNAKINSYIDACSTSSQVWGMGVPLVKRYQRFKESKMREMVLNEIKANLV